MTVRFCIVLSLVVIGCGSGSSGSPDSGTPVDAGGSPVDAGSGRTVTVKQTLSYTSETGAVSTNRQIDATQVSLFVVIDGGTAVTWPSTHTDTEVVFANVPVGEYTTRFGVYNIVTSVDVVDWGYPNVGRTDVVLLDAGTTLTLAVAGLPVWAYNNMTIYSPGAGLDSTRFATNLTPQPTAGQVPTTLTSDYGTLTTGVSAPAIDASKGDSLYVTYFEQVALTPTTDANPFFCDGSKYGGHTTGLTMKPGINAASMTFSQTPSESIGVIFPRTQWVARAPEVHPDAAIVREQFSVSTTPIAGVTGTDLLTCYYIVDSPSDLVDITKSVTLANPYPASWSKLTAAIVTYQVRKMVAGTDGKPWPVEAESQTRIVTGQSSAPGVHAPSALTVQGFAANAVATVAAAAPLSVTWAPSTGSPAPTGYRVILSQLNRRFVDDAGRTTISWVFTHGTSHTFAPGLMVVGKVYSVRVIAEVSTAPEGQPFNGTLSSSATALTNPFIAQ